MASKNFVVKHGITVGGVEVIDATGQITSQALGSIVIASPTKTSDLTNDSGFITTTALSGYALTSSVPTNISALVNDSGFITTSALSSFITSSALDGYALSSSVPTNTSQLTNGAGFITTSALSNYATQTYVNTAVSNLVNTAPTTLDTLGELATALGNDNNFATSITTLIGSKASTASLAAVATSGSYTDLTNTPTNPIPTGGTNGQVLSTDGSSNLSWISAGGGGGIAGTSYIYVAGAGTASENGTELLAAYTAAKTSTPYGTALRVTNRICIVVAPGTYTTPGFTLDTNFIDIVSLTGQRDVLLSEIVVAANNAFLAGLDLGTNAFSLNGTVNELVVENCRGGDYSFGSSYYPNSASASGTFTDCVAGLYSFGYFSDASGNFTRCTAGDYSFGFQSSASGTFTGCLSGTYGFGLMNASGTFTNCTGGEGSFGSVYVSGMFTNCTGGHFSFGGSSGIASGTFTGCRASDYSFGYISSGIFTNCQAGNASWGYGVGFFTGTLRYCTSTGTFPTPTDPGAIYSSIDSTGLVGGGGGGGGGGGVLAGTSYLYVAGTDPSTSISELLTAYNTAKTMMPYGAALSSTNRVVILVGPGSYIGSTFNVDTSYIDIISLSGKMDVVLSDINVTATDVLIRGLDLGMNQFTINSSSTLIVLENCKGGNYSFGSYGVDPAGTFRACVAGDYSFGIGSATGTFIDCHAGDYGFASDSSWGNASGTFTNCTGGRYSFGGVYASGTFTNCTGGDYSFCCAMMVYGAGASGTFTNCRAGSDSFGGGYSTANGNFTNCTGGFRCFGLNASGTFNNCAADGYSFGWYSDAPGVFNNCRSGPDSFGNYGPASGTFTDCVAGDYSFGGASTASGVFRRCRGGQNCFGSGYGWCVASGKFYDCEVSLFGFGANGTASGTFVNCIGYSSFGIYNSASGTFINCTGSGFGDFGSASGKFINCHSSSDGFGAWSYTDGYYINCTANYFGFSGTLTGKLYHCVIIDGGGFAGTFPTVSSGGRTYYCVDAYGNVNNQ